MTGFRYHTDMDTAIGETMKGRELLNMGFKQGPIIGIALKACKQAKQDGRPAEDIREMVRGILEHPGSITWQRDAVFKDMATTWDEIKNPPTPNYEFQERSYQTWGADLIAENAHEQMAIAMQLPISVQGALMPDAHLGYGLPVGGVLATKGAVIPFAVGVDIACRMKLSVLPIDPIKLHDQRFHQEIRDNITKNTRFGLGAEFQEGSRREHEVMDMDWNSAESTKSVKDIAYRQLGSSGSGNHFVDVGVITFENDFTVNHIAARGAKFKSGALNMSHMSHSKTVPAGSYIAILTHSGSRGPGAKIANFYWKLAMSLHPQLPKQYKHLAWLDMDKEGAEYWYAMNLMGEFASANHHCIHHHMLKDLGESPLLQVENHHNFAWKETYDGKELIVHRKGATPARAGVLGLIPGARSKPGFLISGKGQPDSLNSASHGAGRCMSRTEAKNCLTRSETRKVLAEKGVHVMAGGLDEDEAAYKDVRKVIAAQSDLVEVIAEFNPRIVMMSGDGTAED